MEIIYLGHSSFRIKTKSALVVTDPYDSSIGFKMPKVSADIITVSHGHHDHNFIKGVSGTKDHPKPFIVNDPGEYEVSQVFILGISSFHDAVKGKERGKNIIYLISADGLKLAHLGDLGHTLSEKQISRLNRVDVLFIPVGEVYTLELKKAVQVIDQIKPRIVIPMHYYLPGLTLKLAPVEKFLASLGVEKETTLEKLLLDPGSLPEEREVIILKKKQ